jgi:hypothetical protein
LTDLTRPSAPPATPPPPKTWTEAILAEDATGGLDSFDTERSLRRRSYAPSAGAHTPTSASPGRAWFAPSWGDGGPDGEGLAAGRAASLGSRSAASAAAAAGGAREAAADGGALPRAPSGGGARPGPAEANAGGGGSGPPLPHSSSTPALPLPAPGHCAVPEMSHASNLLTEDDARSLAGGGQWGRGACWALKAVSWRHSA